MLWKSNVMITLFCFSAILLTAVTAQAQGNGKKAGESDGIAKPEAAFRRVDAVSDILANNVEQLRRTIRGFLDHSVALMEKTKDVLRVKKKEAKQLKRTASDAVKAFYEKSQAPVPPAKT